VNSTIAVSNILIYCFRCSHHCQHTIAVRANSRNSSVINTVIGKTLINIEDVVNYSAAKVNSVRLQRLSTAIECEFLAASARLGNERAKPFVQIIGDVIIYSGEVAVRRVSQHDAEMQCSFFHRRRRRRRHVLIYVRWQCYESRERLSCRMLDRRPPQVPSAVAGPPSTMNDETKCVGGLMDSTLRHRLLMKYSHKNAAFKNVICP